MCKILLKTFTYENNNPTLIMSWKCQVIVILIVKNQLIYLLVSLQQIITEQYFLMLIFELLIKYQQLQLASKLNKYLFNK